MNKDTLFNLVISGVIAASGASTSLNGDISNLSEASNILVSGGCGGKSGCGHSSSSTTSNGGSYYAPSSSGCNSHAVPNGGCHGHAVPASGCNASGAAPSGYTIHGCGSLKSDGSSVQSAQPAAQPVAQPAAQQPSGNRNYYYQKTTNTPVVPATSDQEKLRQAAEKTKQDVQNKGVQPSNTNAPNNMLPNTRTNMNPINNAGTSGAGTGSSSR